MDLKLLESLVEGDAVSRAVGGARALVTIIEVKGSAPRHPGSAMLVDAAGQIEGTVGGGKGEAKAIEAALEALASGKSRIIEVEMLGDDATGPALICGGVNRMLVEGAPDREACAKALALLRRGKTAVFVKDFGTGESGSLSTIVLAGECAGDAASFAEEARKAALSGKSALLVEKGIFLDPVMPEEKLLILGGGHVGKALAAFSVALGFKVTVADDRPEFLLPGRFAPEVATLAGAYADVIGAFPFDAASYAVILTRGHLFDLECSRALLKREFRYAGLIGSKRKVSMIRDQLKADGYDPAVIATLHSPIGMAIGAETPEEIAVSILAEMIAVRHGVF